MIDDWAQTHTAAKPHQFSVILVNDLGKNWTGTVQFRLLSSDKPFREQKLKTSIPALGRTELNFTFLMPDQPGAYQAEATLEGTPAGDVHSWRDFAVVP